MGYFQLPLVHFSCKAQHFRRKLSCPDRDRNLLQSHQMLCHCCAINQLAEALAEPMLPSDQDLHPLEKVKYNGAALMACLTFSWGGGGKVRIDNLQTRAWVQIWTKSSN